MNVADFLLGSAPDDKPVLTDVDGHYSYADLRAGVAVLTEHLMGLKLAPGSSVAILAPNGLFWVAAYLATLSLGLVVVPIPTTLTVGEAVARISWVGSRAVFVGRREARRFAADITEGLPVLGEDLLTRQQISAPPQRHSSVAVAADQDAVYAFTSGTTGQPRVVRITHRNIQANTESILGYLKLTGDDRILVVLPFTYVFGASLLHTHLRVGASMVIQPNFVYAESIVNRMAVERCTGFAGVPSTFHVLLRNSSFRNCAVPTLRTIQQAGGKLSPVLIRELVDAQPQAKVFVMYGQTEATARLSYLAPESVLTRAGSIGRGIPGVELSVIDESGAQVTPGQVGEIRARGDNISPGYLNDSKATALKMPAGELCTGDLAQVDGDGFIYIVDRAEDFIKSWGYRIPSQDIESVVMHLPELISAAAVGVPDDAAGERVELVVVKRPDSALCAEDVLQHCRQHLAKYMIPEAVHLVERLPLNANGKVSKRELRSLCIGMAQPAAG